MTLKTLAAGALLAVLALDQPAAAATAQADGCRGPLERWTEIDLYFGRNIQGGSEVTEAQFRGFLADTVTPRFPDGLTVLDAFGQFRSGGRIEREKTKLLVLLVPDPGAVAGKVAAVVDRYKKRFRQQSVLRTEQKVCLAFD